MNNQRRKEIDQIILEVDRAKGTLDLYAVCSASLVETSRRLRARLEVLLDAEQTTYCKLSYENQDGEKGKYVLASIDYLGDALYELSHIEDLVEESIDVDSLLFALECAKHPVTA